MKVKLVCSTIEELAQYISEQRIPISHLEIAYEQVKEVLETPVTSNQIIHSKAELDSIVLESMNLPFDVSLNFLSDNPKVLAKLSENNVLYVDELELCENVCMPTKINLLGRSILVNVCSQDGVAHATLNIAIGERRMYNVPFEIKQKDKEEFLLEITRDTFESIE